MYISGLKVGDAPQTQLSLTGTVYPISGLYFSGVFKYNAKHYANFDPSDRSNATDKGMQSWEIPSHSLIDLHFGYDLPIKLSGIRVGVQGHVFNLLDEVYISDADDNTVWFFPDDQKDHGAKSAQVYYGRSMSWNFGVTLGF